MSRYDAFISHASEDKPFVEPLAEALEARGFSIWYDAHTLSVGDSLRQSIDRGLAESRKGIVVLSTSFFGKGWPEWELDGLVDRHVMERGIILPLWHGVTAADVRKYSPSLAGIVAIPTSRAFDAVVDELADALGASIT
jgi:hypothetical protein